MLSRSQDPSLDMDERLRILYPMVNEAETPLPRSWSHKDKYNFIGLSQSNLRVQYRGHGKTHKDASSVRATHAVPASCGIYYFEVTIVSKGRDGYMGVGLSAQGVNMNRLPGWDKHSYGYHGDDGHSFCSSGTGQPYGPTFTTNDVIGCGINLVDGSCFYTKNGHHLGVAFTDLPANLFPTVGLQTPGEIVDANFGQDPFKFDIEGEMMEHRSKVGRQIEGFPTPGRHGDWQCLLHQMVSSYLVHHGFSSTAEAFNRSTGQKADEDLASIRNRQNIQRLVLSGKIGEAVALTEKLYPGLLETNPTLQFTLKVRQFIEMVSGSDSLDTASCRLQQSDTMHAEDSNSSNGVVGSNNSNSDGMITNGNAEVAKSATNGNTIAAADGNNVEAPSSSSASDEMTMEVDPSPTSSSADMGNSVLSNPARFDKLIRFGQSLQSLLTDLETARGIKDERNGRLLQDAFSLLAYSDPWSSPVGWQLSAKERESVAAALNSAILESRALPGKPPLEVALAHTKELIKTMANNDLGSSAFANVDEYFK